MTPQTNSKQFLITLLLLLVLALIVAGYVYFGMNYAKKINPSHEMATDTDLSYEESGTMSTEKKMQILDDLNKEASSTLSADARLEVLNKLDSELTDNPMPEAKRLEILNALGGDQGIPAQ